MIFVMLVVLVGWFFGIRLGKSVRPAKATSIKVQLTAEGTILIDDVRLLSADELRPYLVGKRSAASPSPSRQDSEAALIVEADPSAPSDLVEDVIAMGVEAGFESISVRRPARDTAAGGGGR